jgi:inulin fructotransferase (DFA-I-forming)
MDVNAKSSDSCYSAQVDALLTTEASAPLPVTTVLVDSESSGNTILDSGSDAQVVADRAANALRFTPTVGTLGGLETPESA